MDLVISYDQQAAVLNGSVLLKAVPLSLKPDGDTDWCGPPVASGRPCLGCPLALEGRPCGHYSEALTQGPTCCGKKQRKDGRAIVWRKA